MIKLKEIADGYEKGSTKRENELSNLNMALSRNKIKLDGLIDKLAIVDKDILKDIVEEIKKLKIKNSELVERIGSLKMLVEEEINQEETAKLALDIINRYMDNFDVLDLVTKRTLVKLLVDSVESDGESLYINFIGSDENSPRSDGSRSCS